MDFFTSLLRTYESAAKEGLVDNHNHNNTILLPLYHSSKRSTGKDIISVKLNTEFPSSVKVTLEIKFNVLPKKA